MCSQGFSKMYEQPFSVYFRTLLLKHTSFDFTNRVLLMSFWTLVKVSETYNKYKKYNEKHVFNILIMILYITRCFSLTTKKLQDVQSQQKMHEDYVTCVVPVLLLVALTDLLP